MDSVVTSVRNLFAFVTGVKPQFRQHGGTNAENLALQNIQVSRSDVQWKEMLTYSRLAFAWLLPICLHSSCHGYGAATGGCLCLAVPMWTKGQSSLITPTCAYLASPSLRGYLTKYDCSSADINPIGGISKTDLKKFIAFAEVEFNLPILAEYFLLYILVARMTLMPCLSFLDAVPTAELEPITETYVQSDEASHYFIIFNGLTHDSTSG